MTLALLRAVRCQWYVQKRSTRFFRAALFPEAKKQQRKEINGIDNVPTSPPSQVCPGPIPITQKFISVKSTSNAPVNWDGDSNKNGNDYNCERVQKEKNKPKNSATTPEKNKKLSPDMTAMTQNVKGYFFKRYIDYVKNYNRLLAEKFPKAIEIYRVFFDGVKEFYNDMKWYLKISRIAYASPQGLKKLNRKELELYMQMPRDMVKVAPALILSSLPMIGYAIFPLVFMFPRTFLTSHFWNLQQRAEFQQILLLERLKHNREVFRCLQSKLESKKRFDNHIEMTNILGLLGSGFHPTVDSLLEIKDLFAKPPYGILSISGNHISHLQQMHGLPRAIFKRHRLIEHAFLVHYMDVAIRREGGVHNMNGEALRYSCYLRGLNPTNLSSEEMIKWLRNWVKVSTSIQEEHISLFLHLPLFLAYNHPNNWQLIYGGSRSK